MTSRGQQRKRIEKQSRRADTQTGEAGEREQIKGKRGAFRKTIYNYA